MNGQRWTPAHRAELVHGVIVDPPGRVSLFADEVERRECYEHFRADLVALLEQSGYRRFGRPAPLAIRELEPELLEEFPRADKSERVTERTTRRPR